MKNGVNVNLEHTLRSSSNLSVLPCPCRKRTCKRELSAQSALRACQACLLLKYQESLSHTAGHRYRPMLKAMLRVHEWRVCASIRLSSALLSLI